MKKTMTKIWTQNCDGNFSKPYNPIEQELAAFFNAKQYISKLDKEQFDKEYLSDFNFRESDYDEEIRYRDTIEILKTKFKNNLDKINSNFHLCSQFFDIVKEIEGKEESKEKKSHNYSCWVQVNSIYTELKPHFDNIKSTRNDLQQNYKSLKTQTHPTIEDLDIAENYASNSRIASKKSDEITLLFETKAKKAQELYKISNRKRRFRKFVTTMIVSSIVVVLLTIVACMLYVNVL